MREAVRSFPWSDAETRVRCISRWHASFANARVINVRDFPGDQVVRDQSGDEYFVWSLLLSRDAVDVLCALARAGTLREVLLDNFTYGVWLGFDLVHVGSRVYIEMLRACPALAVTLAEHGHIHDPFLPQRYARFAAWAALFPLRRACARCFTFAGCEELGEEGCWRLHEDEAGELGDDAKRRFAASSERVARGRESFYGWQDRNPEDEYD